LESNLKIIDVSLDAATKETYRKIRRYDFDIPIKNIKAFISARNDKGASFPEISINMTLMRENIEEIRDFVKLANDLGVDAVRVRQLNKWSDEEMQKYEFEFEDYSFSYEKQGLWNYSEMNNANIRRALEFAEEINMPMMTDINKDMYFGEELST
jgi:MoaA/NifB/PqqE/SkfB family radical SAM enzyme